MSAEQKTILVVEDDTDITSLIRQVFEGDESVERVLSADSVPKAQELINQTSPDLILLNLKLREGDDGFVILQNQHGTPVIVMTAYPDEEIRRKCIEMGARDFILKPFEGISELRSRLVAVLEGGMDG